jgi:opacity protein-like surface antigen
LVLAQRVLSRASVLAITLGTDVVHRWRREMNTKLVMGAALAVAGITLASAAAAGPVAARQRVSITAKGEAGTFVLAPFKSGALERDAGRFGDCCWKHRVVTRDGQTIEIDDPLSTYEGARGTLTVRYRIEWADAGNGYAVGTGTWKVVRGTGAYVHVNGGGRSAHAWLPRGFVSARAEGFLTPP